MRRSMHLWLVCATFLAALFPFREVAAQSARDLRINEVLVHNDSNYTDGYGRRNGWIEIFNTAYNSVDVGGLYLTNDPAKPTKYLIPAGQPALTLIPPRSYLLFFADSATTHGIVHLNFILRENSTLALVDANGKTVIDRVFLPAGQKPDVTYGRQADGIGEWVFLENTTPNATNDTKARVSASDNIALMDPTGVGVTLIAMGVVFIALAILFFFFKYSGRLMGVKHIRIVRPRTTTSPEVIEEEEVSGEVYAAIALALFLYHRMMDDEGSSILTIKKVSKPYSPWSSRIYNMTRTPK